MAVRIEWRREPSRQHTGSVELRGVNGSPFLYVHPHDESDAALGSCAGWWWYSNRDTTESPVVAAKGGIFVDGKMSYAAYQATRALYRRLSAWRRIAIGLLGWYRLQEKPGKNLGQPLATYLQVSGLCNYNAYIVFDPPPTEDESYELRAELWVLARGEVSRGSRVVRGLISAATAFDHAGVEQANIRANVTLASPEAENEDTASVLYDLEVAAGTREIKIGKTSTGPAYNLYNGWSTFTGWAEIAYTLYDEDSNVVLQPDDESGTSEEG